MKKLLLVISTIILVFSLALTAMAVDLTVWSGGYYGPDPYEGWYFDIVIKEFQETYPDVNIEVEMLSHIGGTDKVAIGVATGTTADIYFGSAGGICNWDMEGVICDFSDVMTQEQMDDYLPGYFETFSVDGKLNQYLVSGITGAGGMGINKVLVEQAGLMHMLPLDRPYMHWTVDEFKAFIQAMTKYFKDNDMKNYYTNVFNFGGSSGNVCIIMWMFQDGMGIDVLEEIDGKWRCTINQPKAIEALQWYLDVYDDPLCGWKQGAENQMIDWWENDWCTGRLVSCWGEGAGTAKTYSQQSEEFQSKLQQLIVPYPNFPGGSPTFIVNGVGITAFKTGDPEKEKYSKLFCKFFGTRPYATEVNDMHVYPTYSSFDPDSPLYQKPLYTDLPQIMADVERTNNDPSIRLTTFGDKCPAYKDFRFLFSETMQGVFTHALTVEEGLNHIADTINAQLDEHYKENPVE